MATKKMRGSSSMRRWFQLILLLLTASAFAHAPAPGWFRFNWTNTGNLAWEFAAPVPHPVTVPTRTMEYDDDNRLKTFKGRAGHQPKRRDGHERQSDERPADQRHLCDLHL